MPLTTPRAVDRQQLDELMQPSPSVVLSIYHPTEPAAAQPEENSLHLKSLLSDATEQLTSKGFQGRELDPFLAPLEELLDDREMWLTRDRGIAAFRDAERFELFDLPHSPESTVRVSDAPYVVPLLPAIWPEQHFYVLVLDQHAIRLIRCTRFRAHEVDLTNRDIPTSIGEELRYDDLERPDLQHHPTTGPGRSAEGQAGETGRQQRGRRHAFHGHGQGADDSKQQIARFFRSVGQGLERELRDPKKPVILAGVDYLHPIFRDSTDLPNIIEGRVTGSVGHLSPAELLERALPAMQEQWDEELAELREMFGSARPRKLASSDTATVLSAAERGAIDTLFLAEGGSLIGRLDPTGGLVHVEEQPSEGAEDLLDLAARKTLEGSGRVFVLEPEGMPGDGSLAALLRYEL